MVCVPTPAVVGLKTPLVEIPAPVNVPTPDALPVYIANMVRGGANWQIFGATTGLKIMLGLFMTTGGEAKMLPQPDGTGLVVGKETTTIYLSDGTKFVKEKELPV